MEKRGTLKEQINYVVNEFLTATKDKEIFIISHFDTDGITSASIMIKTLKKLDKKFSVKILKNLEEKNFKKIPKDKIILFLDLASGAIDYIKNSNLQKVFIIDHHEISKETEIPENVFIINPELCEKQKISAAGLTYLFCKEISPENKELAKLAVLGMIGDQLEKEIGKLNRGIVDEAEIIKKRGLLIYPSTRPLNKVLEYCSKIYIPGVTGNPNGVLELLREIGLTSNGKCKSLIELDQEEMEKLVTGIVLRNPKTRQEEIIGDIYLLKFFGKLEDARELSAMINACSRLGQPEIALQVCLEIPSAKKQAEALHITYRQYILSALNFINGSKKINGNGFVIINAQNNIKDTIIGTIASILSNSSLYEEGTIIIAMAYYDDKIKISARSVGREGRNVREVLHTAISQIGGEVGGHNNAAGGIIIKEKEQNFINLLKKNLEIEVVKV